ncbi:YrdB family protein [Microbacterium sp. zg.Y1090]|uniref:YrdB family protein n=1 Tax=Microbacterium TaxID=33882 RepID=UPI00214C5FE5|nr:MULTISPECIES: YrdB family protein [unclassified Microbacterium]MCR2813702.1 YrdB family protein [Microbacterium sp. zg.Y1084]MCR2817965.1 YrdB family protein [Microbacterium sp. zg.Y1090]MDL5487819.1 YrdB family protein [Microbacterium sp. zg-Y1211]WIM27871.1 YrdB family protein [Microbacterium sp. zg-Y1090]
MSDLPSVRPAKPAEPQPTSAEPQPGTRRALDVIDVLSVVAGLFAFGTLAFWGFIAWDVPWNLVVGIGAPVVAILLWALFVSPRAVLAVHPFVRALVELLVYAAATIAWWALGNVWVGLGFAVVAVTVGVISGRRRLA